MNIHDLVMAAGCLCASLAAPAGGSAQSGMARPEAARPAPAVIVLVRHAETTPDGSPDPALSGAGLERAGRLARLMVDAGITRVHSSPYRRTRQTAALPAASAGRDVETYDPRDLPTFADRLLAEPGRHLVVGHSNTTPALVGLLGGEPGPDIAEDEHGRIYVLFPADGAVRTLVLRY